MTPRVLTREQAAAYLQIAVTAFDKHARPLLTPVRWGKAIRFDVRDLDAHVDAIKARINGAAPPSPEPSSPDDDDAAKKEAHRRLDELPEG